MHLKNATHGALFALGLLSIGTQVYLVRECMMVFNDHELVIGLVLATWMLITGIGSLLGRHDRFLYDRQWILVSLLILVGMLPTPMIAGLDLLKVLFVPYGSMADIWQVTAACLVVQLPFCFLNGFMFTHLNLVSPDQSPGSSYAWESLGSMAAGVAVNFLFLWVMGPFHSLLILTGCYFILIVLFARHLLNNRQYRTVAFVSIIFLIIIGTTDIRELTTRMLYPAQQLVSNSETPYGQVVITKNEQQLNFYENGMLLFSTGNEISREENVHYAMAQHRAPVNVLLISGGYSGTIREILKYHPALVDYVELNPSLIEIAEKFTTQDNPSSVRMHKMDARKFIRTTECNYDVVLVNLPAPSTLQLNRYYTVEFLHEIRQKMKPGAVISYSLPTGSDYVSECAGLLNSVLYNTLRQSFRQVLIIPATRNYFLASDSSLFMDIPGLIEKGGIETAYVNKYYIDKDQLKERSAYVTSTLTGSDTLTGCLTPSGSIDHDLTPIFAWYQMSWWLSLNHSSLLVILLIYALMLVFIAMTLNPLNAGLFAGGFTLVSLEIILIFGVQVLCGYIFQAIGAIIMVFMLGLAAGAGIAIRLKKSGSLSLYRWLLVLLAVISIFTPLIIKWMSHTIPGNGLINLICAFLAFFAACTVGMAYQIAASLSQKTLHATVSGNYSAEMFGAAAGAFAVSLFLIPVAGILTTGILLAVLNLFAAGLLCLIKPSK